MTSLAPYFTTFARVSNRLHLHTTRARLLALFALIALFSTIAVSASSAGSLRQLFASKRTEAQTTKAGGPRASLARQRLTLSAAQSVTRQGQTTTTLKDGRILTTGGRDINGQVVSSVEIFDPATNSFTSFGSLIQARVDHTASLLSDGRVLITGGSDGANALRSTEIFDPASGFSVSGPQMSVARSGHSANVVHNGDFVLIVGSDGSGEMFNARTGLFSGPGIKSAGGVSAPVTSSAKLSVQTGESQGGATITTDREDYPPYSTVVISGNGFTPGETVSLVVEQISPAQATYEPWTTVADENGNILTSWFVFSDELVGTTLRATATGQSSGLTASTTFTDASTIEGWQNNSASWGTNINGTNSAYREGDVVAARYYETTSAGSHTVYLKYDFQYNAVPQRVFIDYLASIPVTMQANECTGIANCAGSVSTANIPTGTLPFLAPSGQLRIRNANNISVGSLIEVSTGGGSTGRILPVTFTPINAANPVVIAYGVHIASPTEWGSGNGAKGQQGGSLNYYVTLDTGSNTISNGNPKVGINPSAIVLPNTTQLVVAAATGNYLGSVNLTATLTYGTTTGCPCTNPLANEPVVFYLEGGGVSVGTATTNGSGVATLNNVSLGTLNPGIYPGNGTTFFGIFASFAGDNSGSPPYAGTNGFNTLTVTKILTVTAGDKSKTYGDGNPALTYTITGFAGSDTQGSCITGSPNISTTATTSSGVGGYPISISQGTLASSCSGYTFQFVNGNLTVNKAAAVVVVTPYTCPSTVYDGNNHTAAITSITGVNGETGATVGTVDVSNTTHKDAGTYASDSWSFTGTANYNNIGSTTISDCIAKATAVVVVTPYTCPSTVYDGNNHTAAITSITGVNGETGATVGTVDVSNTTHKDAGTYASDSWSFTGTANYNNIGSTTISDCIAKATAVVVVTPYTCPSTVYDGNNHTAAITSITGVNGETGATVGTVDVSNTTHKDAGTYASDSWSFTGTANYNNIGSTTISDCIAKATAVVVVTPYTCPSTVYDGNNHTAAITSITGVNGETGATVGTVDVSNTTHKDAGTYASDSWSFTGTANYNNIGSTTISDCIAKATAVVVVTPYTCPSTVYDGNNHTAAITSITGVNGETGATVGTVDVSNTTHKDAGTYASDSWSFTGTANYNNIGSTTISDCIAKATAVVVVTPYTCPSTVYDGNNHTAAITSITGVNGETGATVGTVDVSNTTHKDAGTYASDSWSFTGTANYNNIGSTTISDCIAKATAVVVVTPYTCPSTVYDGNNHTAAITSITGVNGETGATVGTVDVSNTTHKDAGTYASDSWSFTGTANYNNIGSTTISDCIAKATAVVVVTPYTCPSTVYDGNNHTAAITSITGVNGETGATVGTVDVSNTTHKDAGTYASDSWSFTGTANYNNIGSTTISDCIAKATAVVVVTPYTCPSTVYDGNNHTAAITSITGVNGETGATVGTVDVSNTTHKDAGTYASDSWSFTGTANYNNIGSTTISDCIAKATAVVVVTPYTCPSTVYDGNNHTAAITSITGVNGETGATVGTVDVSNTTHKDAGTYASDSWSFTGTANYNNIGSTTISDCIAKATAVVVVTPYTCPSTVYDSNNHTAAITSITGVNGETGVTVGTVDVSNTTHKDAGTYASDSWSFTGTANYNNIGSTTISDCISPKPVDATAGNYSGVYDGNTHALSACGVTGFAGLTCTNSPAGPVGPGVSTGVVTPDTSSISSNFAVTPHNGSFSITPAPTEIKFIGPKSNETFLCGAQGTYTATLRDTYNNVPLPGVSLTLTIGSQSAAPAVTDANGVATFSLVLTQAPNATAAESVALTNAWTDTNRSAPATQNGTFNILPDSNNGPGTNAGSLYTGPSFFWTTSPTSSTATLTLNATIKDTSPTCPGDITKATVSFFVDDGTGFKPVSNAQNLPVGRVNTIQDPTVGTASTTSQYNIGNKTSAALTIRVVVGGFYSSANHLSDWDVPVVVAVPGQPNTLRAGGYLKNDGITGLTGTGFPVSPKYYADGYLGFGDGTSGGALSTGSVYFGGFVECNNSKCTNPQGQINATIHSYNNRAGSNDYANQHTYFIKSNAISGWGITATNSGYFSAKTNVFETSGGSNTGIDGGGMMQLIYANPGGKYTYNSTTSANKKVELTCPSLKVGGIETLPACASIIVYRSNSLGGGVWFASAWGPVMAGDLPQTIMKTMASGMIQYTNGSGSLGAPVMGAPTTGSALGSGDESVNSTPVPATVSTANSNGGSATNFVGVVITSGSTPTTDSQPANNLASPTVSAHTPFVGRANSENRDRDTGFAADGLVGKNWVISNFENSVESITNGVTPDGRVTVTVRTCNRPDGSRDLRCVASKSSTRHVYVFETNVLTDASVVADIASLNSTAVVYELLANGEKKILDKDVAMQIVFVPENQMIPLTIGAAGGSACTDKLGCAAIAVRKTDGSLWYSGGWRLTAREQ